MTYFPRFPPLPCKSEAKGKSTSQKYTHTELRRRFEKTTSKVAKQQVSPVVFVEVVRKASGEISQVSTKSTRDRKRAMRTVVMLSKTVFRGRCGFFVLFVCLFLFFVFSLSLNPWWVFLGIRHGAHGMWRF